MCSPEGELAYRRIAIKCPTHDDCHKYRNLGRRQCAKFGRNEPIAFLAVWARKGNQHTRDSHVHGCVPSPAEIESWLAANGQTLRPP